MEKDLDFPPPPPRALVLRKRRLTSCREANLGFTENVEARTGGPGAALQFLKRPEGLSGEALLRDPVGRRPPRTCGL